MNICIHRGSKQIGGSCVEIKSQGKSLILDIGLPLDSNEASDVTIPKSLRLTKNTMGLLISHYHQDHIGLINQMENIPYGMGPAACRIMKAASPFLRDKYQPSDPSWTFSDSKEITIGPFKVTPFLVDHSAYDAYSLLIEADGKRVLYSGDFRAHGRKSKLFQKNLRMDWGPIDTLLLEGTTLGGSSHSMKTEESLEEKFLKVFKNSEGMVLVNCSSQNIDRIVTVFRAAKRSGRKLVIDLYTAAILEATENPSIPQSNWDEVELFIPYSQRVQIKRSELFELLKGHSKNRIYEDQLVTSPMKKVMLFRPSFLSDEIIHDKISISSYIYSQWQGYLEDDNNKKVKKWLAKKVILDYYIHTSGHAGVEDLKEFVNSLNPVKLIPIHSFHPEEFERNFDNVESHSDGEWWEV